MAVSIAIRGSDPRRALLALSLILGALGCTTAKPPPAMGPDPNASLTTRVPLKAVAALLLPRNPEVFKITREADSFSGSRCFPQMDFGPAIARILSAEYLQLFETVVPTTDVTEGLKADIVLVPSATGFSWFFPEVYVTNATVQLAIAAWKGSEKIWEGRFQHDGEVSIVYEGCTGAGETVGKAALASIQKTAHSSALALEASGVLAALGTGAATEIPRDPQAIQYYFSGDAFPYRGVGGSRQAGGHTQLLRIAPVTSRKCLRPSPQQGLPHMLPGKQETRTFWPLPILSQASHTPRSDAQRALLR